LIICGYINSNDMLRKGNLIWK